MAPPEGLKAERWELFDMETDRTEQNNLAKQMPDKVAEMSGKWDAWSKEASVYPKP